LLLLLLNLVTSSIYYQFNSHKNKQIITNEKNFIHLRRISCICLWKISTTTCYIKGRKPILTIPLLIWQCCSLRSLRHLIDPTWNRMRKIKGKTYMWFWKRLGVWMWRRYYRSSKKIKYSINNSSTNSLCCSSIKPKYNLLWNYRSLFWSWERGCKKRSLRRRLPFIR
jgi:hypothetical protein